MFAGGGEERYILYLGLGFRVQGLGLRVYGLGFRVQGLGFRAVPPTSASRASLQQAAGLRHPSLASAWQGSAGRGGGGGGVRV